MATNVTQRRVSHCANGWLLLGLGLLLLAGVARPAQAASFDCKKAGTRVEHLICDDRDLSQLDEDMADIYTVEDDAPATDPRRVAQRGWLARRNACKDADCVNVQYQKRLVELFCDPDGPRAASGYAASRCQHHQLKLLDRELANWERRFIDSVPANTSAPDRTRELAEREVKAWREYREASCWLYGAREGGNGAWQGAMGGSCEVSETKKRIAKLKGEVTK